MKKLTALILALAIISGSFTFAFADEGKNNVCDCGATPVIYIPGFGAHIYDNPKDPDREYVFPPENHVIVECIPHMIKAVFAVLISGRYDEFGDAAVDILNKMLMPASANFDGTPLFPETGIKDIPLTTDAEKHKIEKYEFVGDIDEDYGEYTFEYDWRLDPFYNAELLYDFSEYIKELTGHNEVIFACHSQGSTVVATYLSVYGNEGIEKVVFMCPAFQGISILGSLYTGNYQLAGKGEELAAFLSGMLDDSFGSQVLNTLIGFIIKTGLIDSLLDRLQTALDSQIDKIMDESIVPTLGSLPGTWTFIPEEDYEDAIVNMFGNDKRYAPLIEKLDRYHYEVKINLGKILAKAQNNGTAVIITAGYGLGGIPINSTPIAQSDFLIDTKYASAGATCADFGSDLGGDYIQADTACGHNHISPDNCIDASTCAMKESTWFIKGMNHNDFNGGYLEFIDWAITFDGQPTIESNENYPQFMQYSNGELVAIQ